MHSMEKIIKAALFTKGYEDSQGLPLNIVGSPGTGKSAMIRAVGKMCGIPVETLIAQIREPSDFGGIPFCMQDKDGHPVLKFLGMPWAHKAAKSERMIVFIDEVNLAPQSVQGAVLRLILERVCGDLQFGAGVRFLSAMNPVEESAGGDDLAPPLANRFGWIDYTGLELDHYTSRLLSGDWGAPEKRLFDPAEEEARVDAAWPLEYAKAKGVMAAFLRARPELLHKLPAEGDPNRHRAWPSRRTNEFACRAMAGSIIHSLTETETDIFVSAFIGQAAGTELIEFRNKADLPPPDQLLDGQVRWKHSPERLDRTVAVLSSCAAFVCEDKSKKRMARVDALWKIMGGCLDTADCAVPSAAMLVDKQLAGTTNATAVLPKILPLLRASGFGEVEK